VEAFLVAKESVKVLAEQGLTTEAQRTQRLTEGGIWKAGNGCT